jgi:hypothetical protein
METDESGSVGVKVGPNFAKVLRQSIIKKSRLLNLSLIVALQNDSNKQLKKDEAYDKVKASEVKNSETCITTSDCIISSFNIIIVVGIFLALSENRLIDSKRTLNRIP